MLLIKKIEQPIIDTTVVIVLFCGGLINLGVWFSSSHTKRKYCHLLPGNTVVACAHTVGDSDSCTSKDRFHNQFKELCC